jgi:thiol-disulfide isomerase/thioredoxin
MNDIPAFLQSGSPKLIDASSNDFESTLMRIVHSNGAKIIYIYSPGCGHCVAGAPVYTSATKFLPHFYRFNATPNSTQNAREIFKRIVGAEINYYPMILGISNEGRLVVFNGTVTKESMTTFLRGLEQT